MAEKTVIAEKQLVVFNLAEESYAVDINMVREIIQLQPVTRVPGTPVSVEGVINLRGSVIPIVDLRKRFQLPPIGKTKDTRIVVGNSKGTKWRGRRFRSEVLIIRTVRFEEPLSHVFTDEHWNI
jgi:chemotaxis signal transduction protein